MTRSVGSCSVSIRAMAIGQWLVGDAGGRCDQTNIIVTEQGGEVSEQTLSTDNFPSYSLVSYCTRFLLGRLMKQVAGE